MCEMIAVRADRPVPIETILNYTAMMEEYGIAGFSWGIVWASGEGKLRRYRATDGIRKDTLHKRALSGIASDRYLVHLRRPSLMNSIAHRNAQPYLSSDQSTAFAHNGFFRRHDAFRPRYAHRLEGTSDSEIGFCHWQSLLEEQDAEQAFVQVHAALNGNANIGVMLAEGPIYFYAGNPDNRAYTFELDGMRLAATSLHSNDDFMFQTVFPCARAVEPIPMHKVKSL